MATYKDLKREVDRLNAKYCKNSKNELVINRAYGGYAVELTGKYYMRGNKFHKYKGAMSGAVNIGNEYHDTATNTLMGLYKADSRGYIKSAVKHYNRKDY